MVLASLGDRLRMERERQGLTLDQLAELADLSKPYLSRLESGERQPAIGTLLVLARSLGVSVASLLGEDDRSHRSSSTVGHHGARPDGISIAACGVRRRPGPRGTKRRHLPGPAALRLRQARR